jgi:hypothetical protein
VQSVAVALPSSTDQTSQVANALSGATIYGAGSMGIGGINSLTYESRAHFVMNYASNVSFIFGMTTFDTFNASLLNGSLDFYVNNALVADFDFGSSSDVSALFNDNPINLGSWAGGLADVAIVYSLTAPPSFAGLRFEYVFGTVANAAAVPVPAALPLFGSGLGLMGLMGWLRKRRTLRAMTA